MGKKLEKLLEQREKINARIQKARTRETAQKRKEDTKGDFVFAQFQPCALSHVTKNPRRYG